ncbi:MAG: hypothetical protein GY868_02945 [Deltaproteobacteria bacterium]|nr:hypothetical protein [Deltaproteobacteria bacterium]
MGGAGAIKAKAPVFQKMAKAGLYTFVLTDLDSEECAATLIRNWFAIPKGQFINLPIEVSFRVAVCEVESWIMADRDAFAQFLGIAKVNFPLTPDDLLDPKQHLFNILRRKGLKKWHKEMLPKGSSHIGPLYNEILCEFIVRKWSPMRAAKLSPSLKRAFVALQRL